MDTKDLKSSCLYKEVHEIPLVQSLGDWYTSARKSAVLGTGLAVVEGGLASVWERVFMGSEIGSRVDALAGGGLSKLKEKYPAIQTPPKELKDRTSKTLRDSVRSVMKTMPGKLVITGLDWTLDSSERLLKRIRPRDASPRKRRVTRSTTRKAMQLPKEHSYASEDSGACEGDSSKVHKAQQTISTAHELEKPAKLTLLQKAYRLGFVFPVEVLVQLLKYVRWYVGGKRRIHDSALSPEKEREIDSRRKISPRKKVTTTLLGRIKQRTYRLLGYKNVHSLDLGKSFGIESPDRGEVEKKRKHDEILTDEATESEAEDFANFDYDNYVSEEDPDYEPDSMEEEEDESSDLEDSGEAESDLETEITDFPQLKEKEKEIMVTTDKPSVTLNKSPDEKLESKDAPWKKSSKTTDKPSEALNKSPDKKLESKDAPWKASPKAPEEVSLKPQWQKIS